MTNPYYNENFTAALGSQGRSRAMDAEFVAIEQGFDLLNQAIQAVSTALGRKFVLLTDCPSTYTDAGLKLVRVNAAASALEFVAPSNLRVSVVGGTAYTLVAGDAGALVLTSNGSPVAVTVPPSVFAQGDVICLNQYGAGQVTFAPGVGVTILSSDNLLKTRKQHAQVALECVGTNEFILIGERNAPTLGFAALAGGNQFDGAQAVSFVSLTDAASVATDASLSNHFIVTLAGNRTLANPTNLRDGVILNWWVAQDGTGSRTLAYGSMFKWPGGAAPVLSTAAGSRDLIVGQYNAALGVILATCTKGFA